MARYSRSGRLMRNEGRASELLLACDRMSHDTYNPARAMVVAEMLNPPRAPRAASTSIKKVSTELKGYVKNDDRQKNSRHIAGCQCDERTEDRNHERVCTQGPEAR